MKTLNDLGTVHGTDKASGPGGHDYLRRYEPFFAPMRESARKIFEIGIAGGASLKVWRDYFPYATIFGMDHSADSFNAACRIDPARIQPILGDASLEADWKRVEACWDKDFDIIVDDGAHTAFAIVQAFEFAWPLLRIGGLYVIEDLHTGHVPAYQRDNHRRRELLQAKEMASVIHVTEPSPRHRENSTVRWFCDYVIGEMNCWGESQRGERGPDEEIDWVHFSRSFVIIKKR